LTIAIIVDNGEPLLEKCIESLRNQTERARIIIVGGDKTDYELAKSLADEVYGPITSSIGDARVYGVLKAKGEIIISCDSDTIYPPNYVETMVKGLEEHDFVKAVTAEPADGWSDNPVRNFLILFEQRIYPYIPYEHSIAFKKQAFLNEKLHEINFCMHREDIAIHMMRKMIPVIPLDIACYTRMPTNWVIEFFTYGLPVMSAPMIALSPCVNYLLGFALK